VCHQTVSLVARHLEANGIATVILGSALDIVEHCGVPRFAFVDFPLGNPCGKPYEVGMQHDVVTAALALLDTAKRARTTAHLPYRWSDDERWRERYLEVRPEDLAELAARGAERRAFRERMRAEGRVRQD
jgi:D-proline reductase (dithiol) PrdB